jgi:hypothetical protein
MHFEYLRTLFLDNELARSPEGSARDDLTIERELAKMAAASIQRRALTVSELR